MKTRTLCMLLSLFAGCTGAIVNGDNTSASGRPGAPDTTLVPGSDTPLGSSPGAPSGTTPGTSSDTLPGVRPAPLQDSPGPMPLRRLTRAELGNTLHDLTGASTTVADSLPPDGKGESGFQEGGDVSALDVVQLLEVVERVSVGFAARLPTLMGCDPVAIGEDACAGQFIAKFGRRAYRRPLSDAETAKFVAFAKTARTTLTASFVESIGLSVQALLLAPSFLYHWELGPVAARAQSDGLVRLGAHELASRLSYFLWGSMPDDALFDAVDRGRLWRPQ